MSFYEFFPSSGYAKMFNDSIDIFSIFFAFEYNLFQFTLLDFPFLKIRLENDFYWNLISKLFQFHWDLLEMDYNDPGYIIHSLNLAIKHMLK